MGPGTAGRQSPAQSLGIESPNDEVMTELIRFVAYHPNPRLIKVRLDGSGRVVDRWPRYA